jgi:hypothetical protein
MLGNPLYYARVRSNSTTHEYTVKSKGLHAPAVVDETQATADEKGRNYASDLLEYLRLG